MPTVNLVAYTNMVEGSKDPLMPCKLAASICYDSKPSSAVLKSCYAFGHGSVLEHTSFTFYIGGISRSCSHQLVRHRLASFDQRSQRYCEEDGFGFYSPEQVKANGTISDIYDHCMETIQEMYQKLKSIGLSNEDAREVLPNACHTELYMTMNLRELAHFMNLRLCSRAQRQIQDVAKLIRKEVLAVCPEAEYMLVPKCEATPGMAACTERNCCGKHPKLSDVFEKANHYDELCH